MDQVDTEVLIIGAGACGLLLAQGLKSAGIPYTVFEGETAESIKTRSRHWGMNLHWGGEYLDKVLSPELKARLRECNCDPFYEGADNTYTVCNGKTGEVILAMQGVMPRRVSRRKLKALLSEGIDIQYGRKLVSIHKEFPGRVTACFEGDFKAVGSNLIGCDGSRSRVREFLVGTENARPIGTDISILNFPYSYTAEQARELRGVHPIIKIAYHPEHGNVYLLAILEVEDPDKPEDWKYQSAITWKGPPSVEDLEDPRDRVKYVKKIAAEYADPWRTAGTAISDDAVLPLNRGTYWMPKDWDNRDGTITLAGDAAHPMLPHRGQGLNHALQDAALLVQAMESVHNGKKSLAEAIGEYETEMRPRACQEVQLTLEQAHASHDWELLMQSPIFKLGVNKPTAEKET
ncbi:hypothetical protein GJ744_003148 [Endocarpon pusillum]|uniref:FAD-binding domain-containing protein n=1 Tax=Endocarpon pusillum TaxID=364733 RepID=A0A8H7E834_9EURO|nr:hypothetical protein GJ744_003148 [Endocarpon pusillum]